MKPKSVKYKKNKDKVYVLYNNGNILTRDNTYKIDDPNVTILGGVSDLEEYINDDK